MANQLDNLTKLYRIRKTAVEMLADRGYLVVSVSSLITVKLLDPSRFKAFCAKANVIPNNSGFC